jgi:site-specific recombinase XerD
MDKQDLISKLDDWLLELKYDEKAANTLKQYKNNVMKFIDWLPDDDKPITKVTTMDYKEYLRTITQSPKSMNVWIVSLNKYLRWLGHNDLTIKKYKMQEQSSNEESLTIADFKRLLRIANRIGNEQLYYIIKVLGMTGCRIGELKYFTVENLEKTPRKNIKVYNKGKDREIVIRQDLSRELKHFYKKRGIESGFIFLSTDPKCKDKMPCVSTIWRQMQKVAGLARINKEKVHPHNFRHLFAQVFLDTYPENVLDLADLLGHNDLKTTRIYTKTSGEQKRIKLEKVKF